MGNLIRIASAIDLPHGALAKQGRDFQGAELLSDLMAMKVGSIIGGNDDADNLIVITLTT